MDAGDLDLARESAGRAQTAPDGLSVLGTLMLKEGRVEQSLALFDRALALGPGSGRANIGKGLALLSRGDPIGAAEHLDLGAEAFGDHLGSWIAAGWAYFAAGDHAASRARFERALACDDTFAEIHGGLAVLDAVEGDFDRARRRTEVALRLDAKCFSGALARSLLLASGGHTAQAGEVRARAMETPVGPNGETLAELVAAMATGIKAAGPP